MPAPLGVPALALEALPAEERERRRLSVAVHDEILQPLALARLALAGRDVGGGPGPEAAAQALALIDEAIAAVRALSGDLGPPVFYDTGLEAALQAFCVRAAQRHALPVLCHVEGPRRALPQEAASVVHRAGRELLHNALKHARASGIDLTLTYAETAVVLAVTDNGDGFAAADAAAGQADGLGSGLSSLGHQLRALGGWLRIDAPSGGGARVEVGVPW